jgi:hypothetical protein
MLQKIFGTGCEIPVQQGARLGPRLWPWKIYFQKNRRDERIRVIIHIYMEMSQGNSLCSYLKQNVFFTYFFYKIGEQEGGTGPAWRAWHQWEGRGSGERVWESEYSTNTVYTCM